MDHGKENRFVEENMFEVSVILSTVGRGVCIPACTGQGVCVSQYALGRGVSAQEGGCVPRTGVCPGGIHPPRSEADTPPTRWQLQWTVRIPLECILV